MRDGNREIRRRGHYLFPSKPMMATRKALATVTRIFPRSEVGATAFDVKIPSDPDRVQPQTAGQLFVGVARASSRQSSWCRRTIKRPHPCREARAYQFVICAHHSRNDEETASRPRPIFAFYLRVCACLEKCLFFRNGEGPHALAFPSIRRSLKMGHNARPWLRRPIFGGQ